METRHAKRRRLAGLQQADEGLDDEDEGAENADQQEEEVVDDEEENATPALTLPVKWKRQRRLLREALESSGMFEDLCGVVDGYLGKMDVSELRCVRTIGSRGEGNGQFGGIRGISVDAQHIVAGDWKTNSMLLFERATGAFVRKFGSQGSGQWQFQYPAALCLGVCLDAGNVYACDAGKGRVQVLTKEGVFVRRIGDASGDGSLVHPQGISVDEDHVCVSSSDGHFVSLFDKASGAFVRKFGSLGRVQGEFYCPSGVCLDGGNVYVCDYGNNRVQVLTKEGVFVRFIGEASGGGTLEHPTDVAVDDQHVFVAVYDNSCIKVFTKQDGSFVREVRRLGVDRFGPHCLVLIDGLLYASDADNGCVAVFEG